MVYFLLLSKYYPYKIRNDEKYQWTNTVAFNFKNLLTFIKDHFLIEFIEGNRMFVDYETRRIVQFGMWMTIVLALMTYFLFHAVKGDRGILAWSRLEDKLVEKQRELSVLENEWQHLDQKVKKLGTTICSDLLEEQSIRILGFSHSGDVVVIED